MKVFVVLLAIIGSILAARQEIGYNALPSVLAKHNRLTPFGSRIVGGDDGDIDDFPFIVSLQYYGSHICGGSIIAANKILTAAHCTDGNSASSLSILAGITNLNDEGQSVRVASIHQHPNFSFSDLDADISVLHLVESLTLSHSVAVIALPQESDPVYDGYQVTVLGWGAIYEGGGGSDHLQYVNVEVVSNEDCNGFYGGGIFNGMLCAGVPQGGKDACQGDSGGPLISRNSAKLVGIVSWGYGCARPDYPGVYTRVSAYRTWIDSN